MAHCYYMSNAIFWNLCKYCSFQGTVAIKMPRGTFAVYSVFDKPSLKHQVKQMLLFIMQFYWLLWTKYIAQIKELLLILIV